MVMRTFNNVSNRADVRGLRIARLQRLHNTGGDTALRPKVVYTRNVGSPAWGRPGAGAGSPAWQVRAGAGRCGPTHRLPQICSRRS